MRSELQLRSSVSSDTATAKPTAAEPWMGSAEIASRSFLSVMCSWAGLAHKSHVTGSFDCTFAL